MIQLRTVWIIITILRHVYSVQDVSDHPAWKILDPLDCGYSAADRIIGGINASLGQFPWVVRLGYKIKDHEETGWMCGGVLVSDRHVVTAAHCVQSSDEAELYVVRVGEYDISTNPDCQLAVCAPPVQDKKILTSRSHSSFNNPLFQNDIAIITMDSPVQFNDYVTPICLPRGETLKGVPEGELVTAAGWGKMNMTTEEHAVILQFISLPIVRPEECNFFGNGFQISLSQICAGGQVNRDACGGDSGGPLMKVYDTIEGPKNFLVGVVSFGPSVCGIKKPAVYTSVPYYIQWILDNMLEINSP